RILSDGYTAKLDKSTWTRLPIFNWLQQHGNVDESEMHRVFNCGVGMVVVIAREHADAAIAKLKAAGETVWRIGQISERQAGEAQTVVE
ncbi:MAG TPA: AIR synthase-related protein, partial [Burkholderiales bacterium]|nr:AIR synthase-related protein [Burkholderiales bacterium]